VFGTDPAVQIQASPVSHAARGKGIPPFQLHYCAQRETSEAQAEGFAKALTAAGVSAAVIPEPGKSHEELNKDLGKPGDPTTEKVFEFLDGLSRSGERAAPDAPRGRRHRQP
jgi:acetyl esterase/lipase